MRLQESGTTLGEGMGVSVSKMTDSLGFFENGQGSRPRAVLRVSER